jgi:hypothetical protein
MPTPRTNHPQARADITTIPVTNTNRSRRMIASSKAVEEAMPETP